MEAEPLPEGPVLPPVVDVEEDLKLLPQVGAHQALHVHEQVMRAGRRRRLLLAVAVLHLRRRGGVVWGRHKRAREP